MDPQVIAALEQAGFDPTLKSQFITIPVQVDQASNKPKPLGKEVVFLRDEKPVPVQLKSIPELFTGSKVPPSFAKGPTQDYMTFFATIEMTALEYLHAAGPARDEEYARLYNHLRRRPDGTDDNPLFSYLQGAARLYLSLRDVSQAEFEAVCACLTRSAKRYVENGASTNYIRMLHDQLHGGHHG